MGVVHFDDHDPKLTGSVTAQVEACGVEDVAQDPQVRHEKDAPVRRVDAVAREVLPHRFREGRGRREHVVVVAESQDVAPVPAYQPEPRGHLVDLVQVEREVPDVVFELVNEWARAPVPDLARQQVRPHAAGSSIETDSIDAASWPDRQPSS